MHRLCSFCGKPRNDVLGMIERADLGEPKGCPTPGACSSTVVRICNECVAIAIDKLLRPVEAYNNAPANIGLRKAARNVLTSIKSGSPGGIDIDAGYLRKALDEYDKA